jgi:hypothetical protein
MRTGRGPATSWLLRLAVAGGLAALPCPAQTSRAPAAQPATRPVRLVTPQEESLWQSIMVLRGSAPAAPPHADWFRVAQQRRTVLRGQLQLYLTLYPGGAYRDEAVRIELQTLFELATLEHGDFAPLCQRVQALLAAPPSPDAEQEAAFWEITCRRVAQVRARSAATQPTSAASQPEADPLAVDDAETLAAFAEFLRRYPQSRYAPRLATRLYEAAAARGERGAMLAAVEHLGTHFPSHAATRALLAAWNRVETIGKPFWLAFKTSDGRSIDTRAWSGQPVLIVVWASFDASACQRVREVEAFRRAHPALRVVGVNLDDDAEHLEAATKRLGVDWPQFNDGLGWGNEFARTWGVRALPLVLVLDQAGRLVGATAEGQWVDWSAALLSGAAEGPATRPAGGRD